MAPADDDRALFWLSDAEQRHPNGHPAQAGEQSRFAKFAIVDRFAGLRNARTVIIGCGVAIGVLLLVVAYLVGDRNSAATSATSTTRSPSTSASPSGPKVPTVTEVYNSVGPSVAIIQTAKGSLGTGVIANSAGAVLTANHVISDGSAITIRFADGTKSSATVASADATTDIAYLTPATLPQPVVPATFGGRVQVGASVIAIGNPLGLAYSVSTGVVSALNREAPTPSGTFKGLIQFDASVNPGSSGGPLIDAQGNVIAIVLAIADPGGDDAFAGIAFAMPIGSALGTDGQGQGPGNGPRI